MKTAFFALNRHRKTVVRVPASCWEEVQMRFRVGIAMPDGYSATGIGRCKHSELPARASRSGFSVLA